MTRIAAVLALSLFAVSARADWPLSETIRRSIEASWSDAAIAGNGETFLAIWGDHRVGYDVYASLLSHDGTVVVPQQRIARGAFASGVTWSGRSYLVAYVENSTIKIIEVSATGTPAHSVDVAPTDFNPPQLSIASNGRTSLLVYGSTRGLESVLVTDSGDVLRRKRLADGAYSNPVVASNGADFLVAAYRHGFSATTDVILVSQTVEVVSRKQLAERDVHGEYDLAFNGSSFLFAASAFDATRTWLLDRSGTQLRSPAVIYTRSNGNEAMNLSDLGWSGDQWIAAGSVGNHLVAESAFWRLSTDGSSIESALPLGASSPLATALAASSGTAAVLHDLDVDEPRLTATIVRRGSVRRRIPLAEHAPRQWSPAILTANGVTFAAWREEIEGYLSAGSVRIVQLDASGRPLPSTEREVARDSNLVLDSAVSLGFDGRRFVVFWPDDPAGSRLVRFTPDLRSIDIVPVLIRGSLLAVGDGKALVGAWTYADSGLQLQILSTTSFEVLQEHQIATSEPVSSASAAWNGKRFLAAWTEVRPDACEGCGRPPNPYPPGQMFGALLSGEGLLLGGGRFAIDSQRDHRTTLTVAANELNFLVVAADLRLVRAFHLSSTGTVWSASTLGPATNATAITAEPMDRGFIVTWLNLRRESYLSNFDVHLARLTSAGAALSSHVVHANPIEGGDLSAVGIGLTRLPGGDLVLAYARDTPNTRFGGIPRIFVEELRVPSSPPRRRLARME